MSSLQHWKVAASSRSWLRAVRRASQRASTQAIAAALADHIRWRGDVDKGRVWVSPKALAQATGQSKRTVERALSDLRHSGLLATVGCVRCGHYLGRHCGTQGGKGHVAVREARVPGDRWVNDPRCRSCGNQPVLEAGDLCRFCSRG